MAADEDMLVHALKRKELYVGKLFVWGLHIFYICCQRDADMHYVDVEVIIKIMTGQDYLSVSYQDSDTLCRWLAGRDSDNFERATPEEQGSIAAMCDRHVHVLTRLGIVT